MGVMMLYVLSVGMLIGAFGFPREVNDFIS